MTWHLSVSLRYITSRHKEKFISIISLISIIGVAVGVASLIIVIGVMSGFDADPSMRVPAIRAPTRTWPTCTCCRADGPKRPRRCAHSLALMQEGAQERQRIERLLKALGEPALVSGS